MSIRHFPFRNGQSLVEMALLLPILLLLSVVTIDIGRGIYYYSVIYNAAREGARYGIVHQQPDNINPLDTGGIELTARNMAIGLNQSNLTVSVQSPIISDTIKVDVKYCFQLVTPIAKGFLNSKCTDNDGKKLEAFELKTSSTMAIER
jgi:Flp pilus assembly protein TadG